VLGVRPELVERMALPLFTSEFNVESVQANLELVLSQGLVKPSTSRRWCGSRDHHLKTDSRLWKSSVQTPTLGSDSSLARQRSSAVS